LNILLSQRNKSQTVNSIEIERIKAYKI